MPQRDALNYREFSVRAETVDEKNRSVEAVVTTESPVPMFDWERYEIVPEVLLMKGAQYPKQVPFLNAHSRFSVDDQLGSARELRTEGDKMLGRMFFATASQKEFDKVREGHVTDVSAGYQNLVVVHVPRGQKQVIEGREFTGPVNVVTKWKLREVSLVPIGADEQAKLRGLQSFPHNPKQKEFRMNEQLRALCVARGMDASLSDADAQAWMVTNFATKSDPAKPAETIDFAKLAAEASRAAVEETRKLYEADKAKTLAFRKEVDAACQLADLDGDRAKCYDMADITAVRTYLLEQKAKREEGSVIGGDFQIRGGEAQRDKHSAAIRSAFLSQSLGSLNARQATIDQVFPAAERAAAGADVYRHARLLDMARECLILDGYRVRGLSPEHIALAALGFGDKVGLRTDAAYHTTGSFTKLTQDAVNKSMMVGYTEAPSTWRVIFRQADSVPDLKTIHRIRMGSIPNLPDWPTNTVPESASFKDAEETYRVQPKSLKLSFSWDLLINDDRSMLGRAPAMFGDAAARTVNAAAWAPVTSNPLMEDGVALFSAATGNRKRQNLTTGVGAPSVTTVGALTNLMRQMRGENTPEGNESQDILNLGPAFIWGGSALETTINQLVNSAYDPASGVNHMVHNPTRTLTPVIEPLLDAASTTMWGLAAATNRIDTIEVTFLQGHESPVTRQWMDEQTLSQNWAVLQAFAAKAMNHRGLQRHNGA